MEKADHETDGLFRGVRPPRPPGELRARALAAATAASASSTRPDRWSRLYTSRSLRLAWGTALVLLVAGHVTVPDGSTRVERAVGLALAGPAYGLDPELVEIVDLPRISEDSLTGLP